MADVHIQKEDDKPTTEGAEPAADAGDNDINDSAPATTKSQPRRKSTSVTDKGKKLNRKASKAKVLHLDAKPGDHYFAKLKGFPPWPVVICEEDMLPHNMLNSRPVTASRPDGTYREDFADGGKRVADRTFPVMYLHTNEFSWTPNTDLSELDATTVADVITTKMRKDLQAAHLLAAESHDLDYYKNVLREFEEQRLAKAEAKKSKVKTPKKSSKAVDDDGDVDMDDVENEAEESTEKKPKSKKRKAEDESNTPQRSDSVKKPKIKLTGTSTPKTANGIQSPATKDSAKSAKAKSKSKGSKEADNKKEKEPAAPKEPELTPEERRARKEKEILFLRHRLQRGLLPREGSPVPDEMKQVSDFLAKLETFPDLDVSIIRATKINKVLKAILKLESIPKEEEFRFKPRSQTLLDKWNILLASDGGPAPTAGSSSANANGVNGTTGAAGKASKDAANGVKESSGESKTNLEKTSSKAKSTEPGDKTSSETKEEAADTEKTTETEAETAAITADKSA
ncbi:hypothetical protein F5B22DRAFT_404603 [Xylaria bambusicola]|uniref:uncharacterized protein n=1 Tax=Xylaria bambusicola TaxID=326684 RepID=UPI002007ECC2|nr:uncharacterized protein F5B22DRAFT_404603 [Xylaria bambusicola]KAI0508409.1 hypothetical protein F5B22DRAFT_404603 [Xylaria bambusicola]